MPRLGNYKKLKVGIVGCGAIGSSLAKIIRRDFPDKLRLAALYDTDNLKSNLLAKELGLKERLVAFSLKDCIQKVDLVIEAASAQACANIVQQAIIQKRSVLAMSVGGLLAQLKKLTTLAQKNRVKIYIPSGAICGIDAVKAARLGQLTRVVLVTRKPALSFLGVEYVKKKGLELTRLKQDKVIFRGPAQKAVRLFPQNINVAAVLSLAGLGERKTQVEIIASPFLKNNVHRIELEADCAKVICQTENVQHPENPKTSYLAILSAVSLLRRIVEPVEIGT